MAAFMPFNRGRWVTLAVLLMCSGCSWFAQTFGQAPTPASEPPSDQTAFDSGAAIGEAPGGDELIVIQMQFDVLRVELPAQDVQHSEKVWNYTNELCGDPVQAAMLRRNGFRVGAATADTWAALRAMFEACGATATRASHIVQHSAPLTLDLGPIEHAESFFLFTPDNQLIGQTFDRGNKYIHLDYAVPPEAGGAIMVQITPEVHRLSQQKRWRREGDEIREVHDYEGKVYHLLSHMVNIPPGQFLIIGPDTSGASALSVGHRFLRRKHMGKQFETVLCITPQPFRVELAKR